MRWNTAGAGVMVAKLPDFAADLVARRVAAIVTTDRARSGSGQASDDNDTYRLLLHFRSRRDDHVQMPNRAALKREADAEIARIVCCRYGGEPKRPAAVPPQRLPLTDAR